MFTYKQSLTPVVDSVWPRRGGTAGGTLLTIRGSSLSSPLGGTVSVSIDGAPCKVHTANSSTIQCYTSPHRSTLTAVVRVQITTKGTAVEAVATVITSSTSAEGSGYFQYIDRWSSIYTWGGNSPPKAGESVSIRSGQTLLLDISPPPLNLIIIQGDLIFDDSRNIVLQAKYIFIHGGRLQVGTPEQPFQNRAVIRLLGNVRDPEIPVYGAKVLALRQGSLELHGKRRMQTWTRLAQTAEQNATVLHLQEPVDWAVGESIVLAPTVRDNNETEVLSVSGLAANGYQVLLNESLKHTHHGITENFGDGHTMEIRAEVGLLSRNVIVEGSVLDGASPEDLGSDQYGVHIMVHRVGFNETLVRLNSIEVRHAGQAFRLGRYAIHFHLSGNMSGSSVRFCSIHHSFNRAITAHGVHNMLFEGNVAYDIMGHTYFIEDGVETENRYIRNLGLVTRGSSSLLNTDQIPATFWITNPNNIFIGNAAAGSRAYGFWYDLDDHSFGPSYSISICPNKEKMGTFEDNVAHSNAEFGFRIWETYTPYENPCKQDKPVVANFYRLTTYANGIHGLELTKVGHVRLIGFKVADNRDNGMEILEAHGNWDGPRVEDALIASYTSVSTSSPGTGGIKFPNQRWLTVSNVTFANFDTDEQVCMRACSHCKVRQGGFMYFVEKLNFLGKSTLHRVSFQWEHEVLFRDLDGTLGGNGGGWVLPANGLLPPDRCTKGVSNLSKGVSGAWCSSAVSFVRLSWNKAKPLTTLMDKAVVFTNHHGNTSIPWRHYRLTHMDGYMVTLLSGYTYLMEWQLPANQRVDVTEFSAGIYNLQVNDTVLLNMHFHTAPDHFRIGSTEVDIGRVPNSSDFHRSWHFNNVSNQLVYLLSGESSTTKYTDRMYNFFKDPCPVTGCPLPKTGEGPIETRYRRWSNPDDWLTGRVPVSGQDVTILSTWKMLLDTTPPPLGQLNVYGQLEFDHANVNLTASNILLFGSRAKMLVGTSSKRFVHSTTITLTGNRRSPTVALSRTMVVGAKALGVFGELRIFGKQRTVSWTRLARSALKGSTTLYLSGSQVDWQAGEEVIVAASSYDLHQTEVVKIIAVQHGIAAAPGGLINLDSPLHYDHIVEQFLHGNESQRGFCKACSTWKRMTMSPEVGLLSRNVRIVGDDSDGSVSKEGFGCRILIGQVFRGRNLYSGSAQLDGVEIKSCGQSGFHATRDPRYALVFKGTVDSSKGSFVRNCAFNGNLNTALGVHLSNGITLDKNVFYRSQGSTVIIGGHDNQVLNNLAALTISIQGNQPKDNHAFDYPATFDIGGKNNRVRGNAAAGSERLSFSYIGTPCTSDLKAPTGSQALFWDNTAHSGLLGLRIFGLSAKCSSAGGFRVTHHWAYGVFAWTASRLILTDVAIGVGRVGLCINNFGPDPVKHLTDDKWVRIENSLIVGETTTENACRQVMPAGGAAFQGLSEAKPKVGVMMSTFSKKRSKMDGTSPWHKPKSYPAINGRVSLTDITFARFTSNPCGMSSFVFTNNELSPDAMHPFELMKTSLRDVDQQRLVFFHPPNPAWIVQEDCVDMDCDGPKHSIIRDLDGHFLGTSQLGSLIPRAELRFDISRLPGSLAAEKPTIAKRGIARGLANNISATTGGCTWQPSWNGYQCGNLNHQMLVIESMDADTEVRRVSPLALRGGDTGTGKYTDLMNGPMDHGWCSYYTCLKRLSTFFSVVAVNTEYELWLTGSNPSHWRFHLLNAKPDEAVKLTIWYKNIQRKDIYKNGIFIEPTNVLAKQDLIHDRHIPNITTAIGGANYFDIRKQFLHVVLKDSSPIDVTTAPVVTVSFNVVSLDEFFDPQHFVFNLATALGVPLDTVRLVNVISEDDRVSGRSKRQTSSRMHTMTVQIGEAAKQNQTQTLAPPVSEQIADGAPEAAADNVDVDANATATGSPVSSNTDQLLLPLASATNITDAPTAADLETAYRARRQQYVSQVEQYKDAVHVTNRVNQMAVNLVQKVLAKTLNLSTVQVTGLSVALAIPPPVPSRPVILPPTTNLSSNVSNVTREALEPIPELALPQVLYLTSVSVNTSRDEMSFTIPTSLNIVKEPKQQSGHLVFVQVEVLDSSGQRVKSLGIGETWKCSASLASSSSAQLEGQLEVEFVNGLATFTRLRVDKAANGLRLIFSSSRGSLTALSKVVFSVHTPPVTTDRRTASFHLNVIISSVVGTGQMENFKEAVQLSLSAQLDVDKSRIADIQVVESGSLISFDLLEAATTAPPDVPTLNAAILTLMLLASNGSLSITWQGKKYFTVAGSLAFPTDSSSGRSSNSLYIGVGLGAACFGLILLILILLWKRAKTPRKHSASKASVSPSPPGHLQRDISSSTSALLSGFSPPKAANCSDQIQMEDMEAVDIDSRYVSDVYFKRHSRQNMYPPLEPAKAASSSGHIMGSQDVWKPWKAAEVRHSQDVLAANTGRSPLPGMAHDLEKDSTL